MDLQASYSYLHTEHILNPPAQKPEARELDSFAVIAKGAVELCNACSASTFRDKCGGQIFNTDGFNIVVREDDC